MIKKLVSNLPEVYQPIYGHPELSDKVSRTCSDRLEHIARIHDALSQQLGRPLKVLDLGCAQGFFSLGLASRGATVHGVDYLDENVKVCQALARENPSFKVDFEVGRVEKIITRLEPGQYDMVLGLSVFHHIIYEHGVESVKTMFDHMAAHIAVLVFELALRTEPLYWAEAQPENPRALLASMAFVHEIAHHGTHLAAIPRPLFVASNQYWILDGEARKFDTWSTHPHAWAHGIYQGGRRYFFGTDSILKQYRLNVQLSDANKKHFNREAQFLQSPPEGFSAPALIACGEQNDEAWIAMQRLPGRLLLDLLKQEQDVNDRKILLTVLEQLAALEAAGLYHDDVRTWNVLVTEDGTTHLIDYGSISTQAQDCVWPSNLFLSFFIFVHEVATGEIDDPRLLRTVTISPYSLPLPYRSWAIALWKRPFNEWSFQLMHKTLQALPENVAEEAPLRAEDAWMQAIEELLQRQKHYIHHIDKHIEASLSRAEDKIKHAENRYLKLQAQMQQAENLAQHAEARTQHAEEQASLAKDRAMHAEAVIAQHVQYQGAQVEDLVAQTEARVAHAEVLAAQAEQQVHNLLNSRSWRITAPLRWLGNQMRLVREHGVKTRTKAAIKKVLVKTMTWVNKYPQLKSWSIFVVRKLGLEPRLRRMYFSRAGNQWQPEAMTLPQHATVAEAILQSNEQAKTHEAAASLPVSVNSLHALTPRARQIYADLISAIERQK